MSAQSKTLAYFELKNELYRTLLTFLENNDENDADYQQLIAQIEKQKILEKKADLKEFLRLISSISNNHQRCPFFIQKIEKIILRISDSIKQILPNLDIFIIFQKNPRIIYFLHKNKIIEFNDDIHINKIYKSYIAKANEMNTNSEKSQEIEKNLENGENDSYISKLIRNDSIEEFIIYVNKENIPLSSEINQSIYETNIFLLEKRTKIIEYAAFFGSIQIMQYLKMNNVELESSLWLYAIHSNNAEIIQFLEENQVEPSDETFKECMKESIKCHHNNIADYIRNKVTDKKFDNNKISKNIYSYAFKYNNYKFFPNFVSLIYIFYACKYDYYSLVEILLKKKKINQNYGLI